LATTVVGVAELTVTTTTFMTVPGLTQTFNVPANARVYIVTDGGIVTNSTEVNRGSVVDVALSVDGSNPEVDPMSALFRRHTVSNTTTEVGFDAWSFSSVLSLAPGTHTVAVQSRLINGASATVSGNNSSALQGQLTVIILKL
jgi:hypothetical protein